MIIYTELQLNIAHMKKHYSRAEALGGLKAADLWYTYFFFSFLGSNQLD